MIPMDSLILSLSVIVPWALILIFLERLFPYDKGQKLFREGFWDDFFWYTVIQSYVLGLVISWLIEFIDSSTGVSRLQVVSGWPAALQFLFFFLSHDLYIYWFHRLQHNNAWLWRLHEAHHSTDRVDWLSGSRSHPLEILINQTIEFAPIVLLGAAPEIAVWKGVVDALWGMYIHSNINVRSGVLQYVINGPEMHRWHHAHDDEAHNKNYSTKLAVWDWLFGTAFFPDHKPSGYGLGPDAFPKGYLRQILFAFRREQK